MTPFFRALHIYCGGCGHIPWTVPTKDFSKPITVLCENAACSEYRIEYKILPEQLPGSRIFKSEPQPCQPKSAPTPIATAPSTTPGQKTGAPEDSPMKAEPANPANTAPP